VDFVYHRRSEDFRGTTIYPLNRLRAAHPGSYESERRKYEGREVLHGLAIPLLDALWGDVLHLSPFHPSRLATAWREAGLSPTWAGTFFAIPVERLRGSACVWFASGEVSRASDGTPSLDAAHVTRFAPDSFREPEHLPTRYLDYLRGCKTEGRSPRPFAYLPHVLLADELDVTRLELVQA
jgi:hypothetical protein